MKRRYRVALSVAASAGLLGGAGAAMGAVPSGHLVSKVSTPQTPANGDTVELDRLKAELARSSSDSAQVQAEIDALEADIARAKAQRAAQSAIRAEGKDSSAPRSAQPQSPAETNPAEARKAPTASLPTAPVTHSKTGASGAAAAEHDEDRGQHGGSDD